MKFQKFLVLLGALFAISASLLAADHPIGTPTAPIPGTPVAEVDEVAAFNDGDPMPEEFTWLKSKEDLKAYVLRHYVTGGNLQLTGAIEDLNNNLNSHVQGSTPNEILEALQEVQHRLLIPDKTVPVRAYCQLVDDRGQSRVSGWKNVVPRRLVDGTYILDTQIALEMEPNQQMDVSPSVLIAHLTKFDGAGNVNTHTLWVWNGKVNIPIHLLGGMGYLTLVRDEPDGSGGRRRVSYGYNLETGKSTIMTPIDIWKKFTIKNYFEFNDLGRPLFLNGMSVPLYVDMQLTKVQKDGRFPEESQPVARVKVTMPNRPVAIRIGLYDQNGQLWQYGRDLKVRDAKTGVTHSVSVDPTGLMFFTTLQPGEYDIVYHLDAIDGWYYGVGNEKG